MLGACALVVRRCSLSITHMFWASKRASVHPGGMREISPGRARNERIPGVNHPNWDAPRRCARSSRAACGAHLLVGREPGGCARASLHHRLVSLIPPGWKQRNVIPRIHDHEFSSMHLRNGVGLVDQKIWVMLRVLSRFRRGAKVVDGCNGDRCRPRRCRDGRPSNFVATQPPSTTFAPFRERQSTGALQERKRQAVSLPRSTGFFALRIVRGFVAFHAPRFTPWCNGSTRVFEALCHGSNPCGVAVG